MLELFDFLWKASSAKDPFLPEKGRKITWKTDDKRFDGENHENYDKKLTLTICLKSNICGKVPHLKIQDHLQTLPDAQRTHISTP